LAKQKIVEIVKKIVLPVTQEAGLELVDINYIKEGGSWYLRIFIDKDGGVGVEDCRQVSMDIDKLLDEKDPISQAYYLEVSSPGIERPLKKLEDYDRFAGNLVLINTYEPYGGKKKFSGRITGTRGKDVVIEEDGKDLTLPFEQISSARLKVEI